MEGAPLAKNKRNEQLLRRLRAHGLRKRAANILSGTGNRRRKRPTAVDHMISELNTLVGAAEDRISGRPAKRKAGSKMSGRTRKQSPLRRSAVAKKPARTRTKARV
jgi:hypothetical protein